MTVIGADGLTYIATNATIPITNSENKSTNYYGENDITVYSITDSNVSFTNSGIILGGGGSVGATSGNPGAHGINNAGTNTIITNLGAFLGGGGGGGGTVGGGGRDGGAGGGGGGRGLGNGGSIIGPNTNGIQGFYGGGGGGPSGNGGNGTENGGSGKGCPGGNGGSKDGNGESCLFSKFIFGGGGGGGGFQNQGGGGGGYGGGAGGVDQEFQIGGGGGGGGGYGTSYSGDGGYSLGNSGTNLTLNNLQGGTYTVTYSDNTINYGPLFYSGVAPTNYNIIFYNTTQYGQLWCTGVTTTTGTINFGIDTSLSNFHFIGTLSTVLVIPSSGVTINSLSGISENFIWTLSLSSVSNGLYIDSNLSATDYVSYDLIISSTFNSSKGSYTPKSLYEYNPGTITYTNSTLSTKSGYTYVLVDSNGNYVSDELTTTSSETYLTFSNVILETLGTNSLIIYNIDFDTEVVGDIEIDVLSQDEEFGTVTTNPSPLLQNNAGSLTYTNVSITPIVNNNYVLKNIYGSYVSSILYVTSNGLASFEFQNVVIPFGGINNLTIYNITTRKTIVYNIEIAVSTVCFKEGTQILCYINKREVYVPIEKIKEDDYVKVYNGNYAYKKAKFIIKSQLMNSPSTTINKLYKLSKHKNHNLIDDLYITGGHALLHDSLSEDELEKMEALANHYNNYNVVVENETLTEEERENMSQLIKYYRDYKITMFNKYKLIAYYDLNFEEVNDTALYNIYHLVIENDNKYGSFGVFANGILAETTDEAGLLRFPGYEKINCKKVIPEVVEPETILDKLAKRLNKKIVKATDNFLEEREIEKEKDNNRVRKTLKKNKITNKNITLRR